MESIKCTEHDVKKTVGPGETQETDGFSDGQDPDRPGANGIHFMNDESGTDQTTLGTPNGSSTADQAIICVICLELVDEEAIALPCRHNHFHFSCLGTWLQQDRSCPLCKAEVLSVRYDGGNPQTTSVFHLPVPVPPKLLQARSHSRHRCHRTRRVSISVTDDRALQFRRHIYDHQLSSLYVGNNRISRYRNIAPELFTSDSTLIPRAKKWIRRELRALDPFEQYATSPHSSTATTRSSHLRNNEFLLEYIIAILRHIDLKGSAGQAEVLLREHLGSNYARLFLHELENWLRSPFESLEEWDRYVQYPEAE